MSGEDGGDGGGGRPKGDAPEKAAASTSSASSDSSCESSGYLVGGADLAAVAEALGASGEISLGVKLLAASSSRAVTENVSSWLKPGRPSAFP